MLDKISCLMMAILCIWIALYCFLGEFQNFFIRLVVVTFLGLGGWSIYMVFKRED